MKKLRYGDLPHGGFAGLEERRFVKDERVFGAKGNAAAFNGLGNFVYLADANFLPYGETGMHPHHEIDVISVMVEGRVKHSGSMGNGEDLFAGDIQVQRAGGEGFMHNEVNPDATENRMIQLWVLPDRAGESAGYKVYRPKPGEVCSVYGGSQDQQETFYSKTLMDVAQLQSGQSVKRSAEAMFYLTKGAGHVNGEPMSARSLVHDEQGLQFTADEDSQLILIYKK